MLSFPYRRVRRRTPSLALSGQSLLPRPLLLVTVIGPQSTNLVDGLIDSGSDEVVFPERLAPLIGIDLSSAPAQTVDLADRRQVTVRFAQVSLRIAAQAERREWQTWVGFSPALQRHGLLGFAGFQQYFSVNLRGDVEVAELTVNALYPGT